MLTGHTAAFTLQDLPSQIRYKVLCIPTFCRIFCLISYIFLTFYLIFPFILSYILDAHNPEAFHLVTFHYWGVLLFVPCIFVFKAIILTKLPVRNVCYFIVSPQRLYCFWGRHFYSITCATVSYPSPQSLLKGDGRCSYGLFLGCHWVFVSSCSSHHFVTSSSSGRLSGCFCCAPLHNSCSYPVLLFLLSHLPSSETPGCYTHTWADTVPAIEFWSQTFFIFLIFLSGVTFISFSLKLSASSQVLSAR